MKCGVLRTVFITVLSSVLFTPSFSQNYYLVVGAFSTGSDDIKEFTSVLPGVNNDTSYTVTTNNSMLHLYVLKTSSPEQAVARSMKLQEGLQPSREDGVLSVAPPTRPVGALNPTGATTSPEGYSSAGSSNTASEASSALGSAPMRPKGRYFKFTITSDDGSALPGEVHQVDLQRERELGSFTTDSYIDVLSPGRDQSMTMVCGVFGYKQVEKQVDFSNPSLTEGVYRDAQGAWVIPYALERLERGDVSVMYNVSFYKDAVPMLPESQKDLDELVVLMQQNPNYVIKIHGHCNGKNGRTIITMGNTGNFFEACESDQLKGTAKELTNLRADAVKTYLKMNGIATERIKTYGWGGSYMLVDENGPYARLNDRIEIEILKD
jgi:outer membrane protein OmpA-like peptidoglycan-associated protein